MNSIENDHLKAFHDHLDKCKQCERSPFDLCPIGISLIGDIFSANKTKESKMNTPKHSPLPWGIEKTEDHNWIGPMRQDGVKINEIAFLNERGPHLTADAGVKADANADLLVRAVNCHEELVSALKKSYHELNTIHARCGVPWWSTGKSDVTQEYFTSVVEEAREALKKAGAL